MQSLFYAVFSCNIFEYIIVCCNSCVSVYGVILVCYHTLYFRVGMYL